MPAFWPLVWVFCPLTRISSAPSPCNQIQKVANPCGGTFLPARVPRGIWGSKEFKTHDIHPFQSCADLETRVPSFNPARPLVQLSMPPYGP